MASDYKTSYQLEEETLDLGKYWLILKRRWLPASVVFAVVLSVATLAAFLKTPIYQAQSKLLIKDSKTGLTELEIGGINPLSGQSSPLDTEVETILSTPILQVVMGQLKLTDSNGKPLKLEDFEMQLNVSKARAGDVIQLSYKSEDPEEAARVLNTLMEVYLADNLRVNRSEAASAREYIDSEIPKAKQKLETLEERLRRFKERNRVFALEKEAEAAVEATINLAEKINDAQGKALGAKTQATSLRQQLGLETQQSINSTNLSQSPGVQEALKQLQEIESQLAIARTEKTPDHPDVKDLEEKGVALRKTLQGRVGEALGASAQGSTPNQLQVGELQQTVTGELVKLESERLASEQVAAALVKVQDNFQKRTQSIPGLEKQLRQLLREVELSQEVYANLVKKWQELQVLEKQNLGNARVLSPSLIPEEPIEPRKALYVASGLILGTLLAIGVALLLDVRDKSVKTLEDIKALFSEFTMLGVIPAIEGAQTYQIKEKGGSVPADIKRELYVRDAPNTPPSEAIRMVQSNLRYLSSDAPVKVVVITSGIPAEGKSTVAANLALTMAELGHKVLLIDADLRRPVQHRTWELLNRIGLSDVLVGEANIDDAIQEAEPNLDVLTSGVLPPNPSALIDSKHMVALLSEFSQRYSYVIIDSPPLSAAVDTLTLSRMADGLMLVVRPGVAETGSVALSKDLLSQPGHKLLGVVANGVTRSQQPSYSSYYYSYNSEADHVPDQPRSGVKEKQSKS
jgi:polysaccharide biosynthesis transport protein